MPASLVAGLVLNSFGTHAFCRTATTNPPVHSLKFQQRKGFCRTRSRVWSSWLWKRGGTMVESPPAELLSRRLGWLAGRERRATCSEKEKVPPHFERGKSSLHLFSVPFLVCSETEDPYRRSLTYAPAFAYGSISCGVECTLY